jgi:peptidoglycan/xylan/chitin deacetylase (PgdA/CDA1 family)
MNCRGEYLSSPLGTYRVGTEAERQQALIRLRSYVKSLPFAEAMRFVQSLAEDAPLPSPQEPDTLDWDELRSLAARGTTVAAHTHSHPLLTRIPFEEACAEIRTSLETIRREIGQALPLFAYPDGQAQFFSESLMAYLHSQGVRFAVTTVEGSDRLRQAALLSFPRLGMHPRLSAVTFSLHMTPLYAWYKRNVSRSSAASYGESTPD